MSADGHALVACGADSVARQMIALWDIRDVRATGQVGVPQACNKRQQPQCQQATGMCRPSSPACAHLISLHAGRHMGTVYCQQEHQCSIGGLGQQ